MGAEIWTAYIFHVLLSHIIFFDFFRSFKNVKNSLISQAIQKQ